MIRARNLSVLLALALAMTAIATGVRAQDKDAKPADKPGEAVAAAPPKEESSVTDHSIKIGGQVISYKATAATILLKNEKDEPTALVYYTAYTRSGEKDLSQRPIAFAYNGGPGSSSAGLEIVRLFPPRAITVNPPQSPPGPAHVFRTTSRTSDKKAAVFFRSAGTAG